MAGSASTSAYFSSSDELGIYARMSIDPNVFSEAAILKTAYWFTDRYYLFLTKNSLGLIDVEVRAKQDGAPDDLKVACGEFWNKLLDQEVRQKVLAETGSLRDTLLKKAFFEARLPVPAGVVSNESHLPNSAQNFNDDPVGAGRSG